MAKRPDEGDHAAGAPLNPGCLRAHGYTESFSSSQTLMNDW